MNPSYVIALILALACVLIYLLDRKKNELHMEDFLISSDNKGIRRADPLKLAFIFSFIVCSWVLVNVADDIRDSSYATYYAFGYMVVFTFSLLSKTALNVIRDISSIWVLKTLPKPSPTPGGAEEQEQETSK